MRSTFRRVTAIMLLAFFSFHGCFCYRILTVMPYASTSHKNLVIPIICALADRGHQVTFISGKSTEQLQNQSNVREIVVDMKVEFSVNDRGLDGKTFFDNIVENPLKTKWNFLTKFREVPLSTIESTLGNDQIKEMMENDHFDLVLISLVTAYVGFPFAWHFNCPFILLSPNVVLADLAFILGDYEHTEYIPLMLTSFTDHMTLFERTLNTVLVHLSAKIPKYFYTPEYDRLIQSYLPGCPSTIDIENNVSLVFTNTHPSFSYPRANPPTIIEIGAIQCRPAQPLSMDFQNFIESAGDDGVLVFAVGSVIQMGEMPDKVLDIFKNVFARLPQRIIWQWKHPLKNMTMPPNVLLSSWLPQQDILGHPKCRGFITHGGLLSTQEAVYHGVPVIGLPFVIDQENNMVKAVKDGYAIKLDWSTIQEEVLYQAIHSILHEPMYRSNVKRLQSLLRDQPETPLERAIFWTEYVLRRKGAPALELGSRHLSRLQRNLVDVYCFLFAILMCIVTTCVLTIRLTYFRRRSILAGLDFLMKSLFKI